jgi:hypothetical protein
MKDEEEDRADEVDEDEFDELEDTTIACLASSSKEKLFMKKAFLS